MSDIKSYVLKHMKSQDCTIIYNHSGIKITEINQHNLSKWDI